MIIIMLVILIIIFAPTSRAGVAGPVGIIVASLFCGNQRGGSGSLELRKKPSSNKINLDTAQIKKRFAKEKSQYLCKSSLF